MLFRKNKYLDWNTYKNRVDFIDLFYWQQKVRRENIEKISF